jgi:hypothetical protein
MNKIYKSIAPNEVSMVGWLRKYSVFLNMCMCVFACLTMCRCETVRSEPQHCCPPAQHPLSSCPGISREHLMTATTTHIHTHSRHACNHTTDRDTHTNTHTQTQTHTHTHTHTQGVTIHTLMDVLTGHCVGSESSPWGGSRRTCRKW